MDKRVLIVSSCQTRGGTAGLTGVFLSSFNDIRTKGCQVELYNIGFFNPIKKPELYNVDKYWTYPTSKIEKIIRKVPGVRSFYAREVILSKFKKIIKSQTYNLVVLYQVQEFSDRLIKLSHDKGVKVVMYPWGSDILRASIRKKQHLMRAFSTTDYVAGLDKSNVIIASKEIYKVPDSKIRIRRENIKGISEIENVIGLKTREDMMGELGMPHSNYNIVCGYNAAREQRHHIIIDAIIKNKELLPKDYLLIFPVSYSGSDTYINELKDKCARNSLNVFFIRDYISNKKMAYLHLVTDLLIQIQPTDCGSAFMIEALYANNRIITGKWLEYRQFEQFGIPYHLIDKVEDLSKMLESVFKGEIDIPIVPQQLKEMYMVPQDYCASDFWENLLEVL